VLILKNPAQVVVLGIEDGPASRAGVHWGDTILSVNEIDPRNKSVAELEPVFETCNGLFTALSALVAFSTAAPDCVNHQARPDLRIRNIVIAAIG
jgi:predicted metalloprotease with PDZ domain